MTEPTPADGVLEIELEALVAASRMQKAVLRDLLTVVIERLDAMPEDAPPPARFRAQ